MKKIIILLFLLFPLLSIADPSNDDPGFPNDGGEGGGSQAPDNDIPFDDGIPYLIAIAVARGVYISKKKQVIVE